MKSTILAAVLAGAAAGAGSALVATTVLSGPDADAPAAAVGPEDDLADELAALREENRALADALRELDLRLSAVGAQRPREVATAPEPESTEAEELKELVAALKDPSVPPPPNFQQSVTRALEEIREQEGRERDERRQQVFEERLDERLADLALELGLTQDQSNDLRDLYTDATLRQREMVQAARELDDWSGMRDQMRALRDEMDASLARVMSPSQLERYEDLGRDRGRGWGGGILPPSTSSRDDRGGGRGGPGGDRRRGG